jgi:glutamate formiminotransferase
MSKIIECVPNFSEGRDSGIIERIVSAFRAKDGLKLLNYTNDRDHNRMVITAIGDPDAMKKAVVEATGIALNEIDLTKHEGQHPRMGAVDVIPFIPIKDMTLEEADALAKEVGECIGQKYQMPVYLYEKSATTEIRRNLANIRKGEFEGFTEKIKAKEWQPDFGPSMKHPTGGVVAVGARMPLIAFNVNLNTTDLEIATQIARKIRFIGGGLRYCKALGMDLEEKKKVQVSMNLTDYTRTSIYQAVEMIRFEAQRFGVSIAGCELIGLLPLQAVVDTAAYYLGLENFSTEQILETHLSE